MRILGLIILTVLLQGCFATAPTVPSTVVEKRVEVPVEYLTPCPTLVEDVTGMSPSDIYIDLATKYGICGRKQADSIILLKRFSNIPIKE